MHELKQLVDNRLEEFPMSAEKSWVLSDHVHDVGCNDCFVVLASLLLAQTQEVLDDRDEETLFIFLVHGTTDGANGPA